MQLKGYFGEYFDIIQRCLCGVDPGKLEEAATLIRHGQRAGRKVIVVGNGGSAAMASHVAVDFVKAAKIRAINFNEADLITCFANDYGYEKWVVEALEAYADKGDVAILISSSGKSPNIVNGAKKAREMGLSVVTFSGFDRDNPLRTLGDVNLWADSSAYNAVEMTHHIWLLSIVDFLAMQQ